MAVVDPTVFLCFVTLLVVELGTFFPLIRQVSGQISRKGKSNRVDDVYSAGVIDVVEGRQAS